MLIFDFLILIFLFFNILSYFIIKLIYRKVFKSQKKISKFLVFFGSIVLMIFYYTPYSYYLEPSFWEFRRMCELNLLPNNKEKYNKILNYFDLSLDTLDWEELNKKGFRLSKERNIEYVPHKVEYQKTVTRRETSRYDVAVILFANEKGFSLENLTGIKIYGTWYTRRYHLEKRSVASYELEWREDDLTCGELVGYNLKEEENE